MIRDAIAPTLPARSSRIERCGPSAINPHAAWPICQTIVVADLEAAIGFYVAAFGHTEVERGIVLERHYALLADGGLRLVEAPAGAMPGRPVDGIYPGLGMVLAPTGEIGCARAGLVAAGAEASDPAYYGFGPERRPWTSGRALFAHGPAGERWIVDQRYLPDRHGQPDPAAGRWPLSPVLVAFDRWPVLRFYADAFGLELASDRHAGQEPLDALAGGPLPFRILALGGILMLEFRHVRPPATPPWPAGLDRIGHAMTTLATGDLDAVLQRLDRLGVPIKRAPLPLPGVTAPAGVIVRGPLGELIEIVGPRP